MPFYIGIVRRVLHNSETYSTFETLVKQLGNSLYQFSQRLF